MPKNKWEKPKLIILVRDHPEEAVLLGCKTSGVEGSPNNTAADCERFTGGECLPCGPIGFS